uniref:Acyl carrier protein n=1 Tax=Echinostoma caproni TaxID=27848 RepID=A0A183AKG8_9TREM
LVFSNRCSIMIRALGFNGVNTVTLKNIRRSYSHGPPVTKPMIEDRVMLVLRLYDKVDPNKLSLSSDLAKDFGIDSLDHVELVMAIEEEFNFEIPDMDSEKFRTPGDIIRYICDKYDLYD